jgi:hypothetical protein
MPAFKIKARFVVSTLIRNLASFSRYEIAYKATQTELQWSLRAAPITIDGKDATTVSLGGAQRSHVGQLLPSDSFA